MSKLKLLGSTSGHTMLSAPASAGSNTLVLPPNNGSAGQVLQTDGNGNLSWVNLPTVTNYGLKDRTWFDFKNDVQTVNTTSYTTLSNLQVTTGTPASTNSKFLVLAHIHYEFNPTSANSGNDTDEGFGTKIIRTPAGGSAADVDTSATSYDTYLKNNAAGQINLLGGKTFFYVDTPSSSVALTYNIKVSSWNNRAVRFRADSNKSQLMVMELLA